MRLSVFLMSASICWAVPNLVTENILADLSVTFERNQGQWPRDVEFGAHIGGHLYTFRGKEIVIDETIHLELISSSRRKLEAVDSVETKTNYLYDRDSRKWITGVPNYSRIRRRNAFRGVDLVLYGSHGQLEFDYVVAPGASPDQIHFRIRGATLESASGSLKLTTPSGEVMNLRAPVAYQETTTGRKTIDCRFQIDNRGEIAFKTAPFNHALPLLIDPVLTYLGAIPGTNFWEIPSFPVVTNSNGEFYVAGTSINPHALQIGDSPLRAASPCPNFLAFPRCTEAWIIKLDINGRALWRTYFGVTDLTSILTMSLDPSGNVVLGGNTVSAGFPVTPDAYLSQLPVPAVCCTSGFVSKLNPQGSALVYSTFLERVPHVMSLDSHGAVYFSDGPTVQKLTADGSAIGYTIQTPGGVHQITTDDNGNLYAISGPSTQFPVTPGAYSSTDNDGLFILKFDPQGNPLFAASFNAPTPPGASPIGYGIDIVADPTGNVVFTGAAGRALPVVNDPDPQANDCDPETSCMAYIAALDSTGSRLLFSRLLGHGLGHKLALGPKGDVYVAGIAFGGYFPRTFDAFRYCSNPVPFNFSPGILGAPNGFVVRLDSQGRRVFSSFLGTSGTTITHLQLAAGGNLYVGGFQTQYISSTDGSAYDGYFVGAIDTTKAIRVPHACLVNATQNVGDSNAINLYVAPGEMVTLFGEGLGPADPAPAQWNADGSLSKSLAGVQVLFDGIPAPMLYAQANQINCIVPFGIVKRETTSVVVQYAGDQTDPLVFHVAPNLVAPFTKDYIPGADLLAVNEDGTFNSEDHPAARGSILTMYATGLGANQELQDGQIVPEAVPVNSGLSVGFFAQQYGSPIPAAILYQGAAPGAGRRFLPTERQDSR